MISPDSEVNFCLGYVKIFNLPTTPFNFTAMIKGNEEVQEMGDVRSDFVVVMGTNSNSIR